MLVEEDSDFSDGLDEA